MYQKSLLFLSKIFFLTLVLFLSFSFQANSQTLNSNPYGRKYKVQVGDSNQYILAILKISGKNFVTNTLNLENGSSVSVNITQGSIESVKISSLNQSNGINHVYSKNSLSIPNKQTYSLQETNCPFLTEAFDNMTMVNKYIQDIKSANQNTNPSYHQDFSASDTFLYEKSDYFSSNINTSYDIVFNWNTGWIEYIHSKSVLVNGTVSSEEEFNRISHDLVSQIILVSSYSFIIGVPLITVLLIYSWISYKRQIKSPLPIKSKNSYLSFIKANFKPKKTKPKVYHSRIDDSLNIIDEILNETKRNN